LLFVLKNANAGRRRKHAGADEISALLAGQGQLVETHSPGELGEVAREILAIPGALVGVWGGDGSLTAALSALRAAQPTGKLPPVAILPGGTMNLVARSVGIRGPAIEVLARLLAHLRHGHTVPGVLRTPIEADGHVGFLFGVGLLANFLEVLYEGGRAGARRSLSVLGGASLQALWGGGIIKRLFAPFTARLSVDGTRWEKERWVNISAGGIESLGLGFHPYLRAQEKPGHFHLIAHDLSPLRTVAQLPGIWLHRGMRNVSDAVTRSVRIEAEQPLVYSFEGELFPAQPSFALRGGEPVRLLVP
jgi:diacylglycerol kinase family enzyme